MWSIEGFESEEEKTNNFLFMDLNGSNEMISDSNWHKKSHWFSLAILVETISNVKNLILYLIMMTSIGFVNVSKMTVPVHFGVREWLMMYMLQIPKQ